MQSLRPDYRHEQALRRHCKAQAKCEKCGASYGELDATNHVNFEYKNAVKPTETTKGYTGDKYCADCGVFIEKGTEYSAQCAGGCKDLKLVKGTPKTCTADGTIDYYECPKCHNIYRDEKGTILLTEADLVDKCTGHDLHPGTDLFGNINMNNLKQFALSIGMSLPQIVQMIRDGTFDLDHIIGTIKIKDIDHCHDDTDHWLGCQRCGKTLEDLRDELSASGFEVNEKWYELSRKTPHSGGKATCQKKAVCDECGDEYGELGEHRYDNIVTAPTCTKDGYTTHTCSACKDTYTDNETTKTGHIIKFGVCESCKGKFANPFYDVSGNDWFYSAVMWGYYNDPQVAAGMDANIALLGLAHLLDRWPRTLSGGEARRVAIGRALLSNPRFLLLDEPLSSLDRARREEIMALIERVRDALGLPILMVTHDRGEAERMGTRIVEV